MANYDKLVTFLIRVGLEWWEMKIFFKNSILTNNNNNSVIVRHHTPKYYSRIKFNYLNCGIFLKQFFLHFHNNISLYCLNPCWVLLYKIKSTGLLFFSNSLSKAHVDHKCSYRFHCYLSCYRFCFRQTNF